MRRATSMVLLLAGGLACESAPAPESPTSPSDAAKPASQPPPEAEPTEPDPELAQSPERESPEPEPEPEPEGNLALPALGLRGTAPAGTEVVEAQASGGTLVRGPDLYVIVLEATDGRPKTPEQATAEVARLSKRPTTETLADGWTLTLRTTNDFGPVLLAQVRRELGGRAIWCEGVGAWEVQRDNVLAFCKSLVPVSG